MAYDDLGPRYSAGSIDPTSGVWVVKFSQANIASRLPLIECYHIYLEGPAGSSFQVLRNTDKWGASPNGYRNEWDPVQPMPLRSGDELTFVWSTGDDPQPQVTIWLRTEQG